MSGKRLIARAANELRSDEGQTFVEYAVLLIAITGIVLAGWTSLDGAMQNAIGNVISAL